MSVYWCEHRSPTSSLLATLQKRRRFVVIQIECLYAKEIKLKVVLYLIHVSSTCLAESARERTIRKILNAVVAGVTCRRDIVGTGSHSELAV